MFIHRDPSVRIIYGKYTEYIFPDASLQKKRLRLHQYLAAELIDIHFQMLPHIGGYPQWFIYLGPQKHSTNI